MKHFALALLLFLTMLVTPASADWRWGNPQFKKKKVTPVCDSWQCTNAARKRSRALHKLRVQNYHRRKKLEWKEWTSLYIPDCIWYGESGTGPEYARYRYTMPNSAGSGAYGKFQFMPNTYFTNARYGDWSPLDQEIAARREYWKHGTAPWTNCS